MSQQDFSTLPHMVDSSSNVRRHSMNVSPCEIEQLNLLLDNSPIPEENWENSHEEGHFGTNRKWLLGAVKEWRHNYDW